MRKLLKARLFFVIPLFLITTSSVVYASSEGGEVEVDVPTTTTISNSNIDTVTAQDTRAIKPRYTSKPKAPDSFWDKLARCETNSNWQDTGNWAGGLGIARSTWKRFGGKEFAPTPDKASKSEQIIVAHRISTQGYVGTIHRDAKWAKIHGVPAIEIYNQKPVGFRGWGALQCAGGKPKLYHYNPHEILTVGYRFRQNGIMVRDLQTFLNVKPDGDYGPRTRAAHIRYLRKHGLSTAGVPSLPKSK